MEFKNLNLPTNQAEEQGHRTYTRESQDQAMKKLNEIKNALKSSQSKPLVRIRLKFDNHVYKYSLELAMELIKNGKAELEEISK